MTWECIAAPARAPDSDSEQVRLRYVEDPSYFDWIGQPGLCDELRANGKRAVAVTFEITGSALGTLRGYRIETVDGHPVTTSSPADGSGHEGANADRHPLQRALE